MSQEVNEIIGLLEDKFQQEFPNTQLPIEIIKTVLEQHRPSIALLQNNNACPQSDTSNIQGSMNNSSKGQFGTAFLAKNPEGEVFFIGAGHFFKDILEKNEALNREFS